MKKSSWHIAILATAYFATSVSVHVHPEAWWLFISLLSGCALLALLFTELIIGYRRWRANARFWFLPSLICISALGSTFLTAPIGQAISDAEFKSHIAEYVAVAEAFKNKTISCNSPCSSRIENIMTKKVPARTRLVRGAICDDGGVYLLFLSRSTIPLVHVGYLFKDYGDRSNCNAGKIVPEGRIPYVRHIIGPWYRFSDQPGL